MKPPRCFYEGVATLTGCIIGAGILGIPYAIAKSGFWTGMLIILVLGVVTILIHLMTGEVVLRTKACHQLVGYADKYIGKLGKSLMTIAMIIGVYGAMVAYTIGVSESLTSIFGGYHGLWAVAFYVIMCVILFGGLGVLKTSELFMETIKLLIFAVLVSVIFGSQHFDASNFTGFSWNLLLPYGIILFAYLGTAAVPELCEELKPCRIWTKRAVIIGTLIPIIVYALFALAVIGVTGGDVTQVATIGLVEKMGGGIFLLLHVFAILAMATSFIALGYALKSMYNVDYRLTHSESWALTIVVPALLVFLGADSFVKTLEITGILSGGLTGILIVLVHSRAVKKSERKPEYHLKSNKLLYAAIIALFSIGILYGIISIF